MITAAQTRRAMADAGADWLIPLMDFVDAFRRQPEAAAVREPIHLLEPKLDALLAGVVDSLCAEVGMDPPAWTGDVPSCPQPWFVSGLESLKPIALAECPLPLRMRHVFVLENFLARA